MTSLPLLYTRSLIFVLYSNSLLKFLRKIHIVIHSVCINLHHQQIIHKGSPYSHLGQPVMSCFLMMYIVTGMSWCLIVVLIFICLMTSDFKNHFMDLLTIWMSLERKVYLSLIYFKVGLFILLLLRCMSFLHILDIVPYCICNLQNFLPSYRLSFHFLMVSFTMQWALVWCSPVLLQSYCFK